MESEKRLFVKVCGITRAEDAAFAVTCGADALGFIAYVKSPRFISPEKVGKICKNIPDKIRKVGVFVDAEFSAILPYIDAGIDIIQFHGGESAKFALSAKKSFNVEIWKAIRPKRREYLERYRNYPAEKFLIDTFCVSTPGGTGKTADWKLAKLATDVLSAPVILAGGLNPANIAEAVRRVHPWGIDVNSGVESSPGIKNRQLIKKIFSAIERQFPISNL